MTCRRHPHRSPARASKCHAKSVRRDLDRRFGRGFVPPAARYVQVVYSPPVRCQKGAVEVWVFAEGLDVKRQVDPVVKS